MFCVGEAALSEYNVFPTNVRCKHPNSFQTEISPTNTIFSQYICVFSKTSEEGATSIVRKTTWTTLVSRKLERILKRSGLGRVVNRQTAAGKKNVNEKEQDQWPQAPSTTISRSCFVCSDLLCRQVQGLSWSSYGVGPSQPHWKTSSKAAA